MSPIECDSECYIVEKFTVGIDVGQKNLAFACFDGERIVFLQLFNVTSKEVDIMASKVIESIHAMKSKFIVTKAYIENK